MLGRGSIPIRYHPHIPLAGRSGFFVFSLSSGFLSPFHLSQPQHLSCSPLRVFLV